MKPPGQLFDPQIFARTIRLEVSRRGVTQNEAARQMDIHKATLSRICKGGSPDVENFLRIARWLNRKET